MVEGIKYSIDLDAISPEKESRIRGRYELLSVDVASLPDVKDIYQEMQAAIRQSIIEDRDIEPKFPTDIDLGDNFESFYYICKSFNPVEAERIVRERIRQHYEFQRLKVAASVGIIVCRDAGARAIIPYVQPHYPENTSYKEQMRTNRQVVESARQALTVDQFISRRFLNFSQGC